jgi:4-hydroxybutyrate CoA-transferase
VALIQVARGRDGRLRLGPNVDFAAAALGSARVVLAELNDSITAPAGCPGIDEARIDLLLPSKRPLHELPTPPADETADAIGAHVAAEIRDGDCIQTGIGAIPAAILARLGDRNDLGLHGGLIDDGGMRLIRNGNVTGARKEIDRGVHVTGMALGSAALVDWLADTAGRRVPRRRLHPRGVVIGRLTTSCRSTRRWRWISTARSTPSGRRPADLRNRRCRGLHARCARLEAGGRSIVAMPATARDGSVSRIVPKVELVTALRTDVDLVVTEFGVARLRDAPLRERAEALIAIAAPQFRDELRDAHAA